MHVFSQTLSPQLQILLSRWPNSKFWTRPQNTNTIHDPLNFGSFAFTEFSFDWLQQFPSVFCKMFVEVHSSWFQFRRVTRGGVGEGPPQSFFKRKDWKIFPKEPFFIVLYMIVYKSALIPRKIPCPKKFLVTRRQVVC